MRRTIYCIVPLLLLILPLSAQQDSTQETLLLRSPSLHQDRIAFAYAGDIWVARQDGSNLKRLTVNAAAENSPKFSPDGRWIAFSGNYDGNTDVYIIPAEGGTPKRLTYHPGADMVRSWQGNDTLLFASSRLSHSSRYTRLFKISTAGGMANVMPIPEAHQGSVSPDGRYTAYIKNPDPTEGGRPFKHYRGGNAPKIWIFDNSTYAIEEIPHEGSNNTHPVWVGNTVYFLSDRNRTTNLFAYNLKDKQVKQLTRHTDFDVKTLDTDGKNLAYEQGGRVHVFDIGSNSTRTLRFYLEPDIPARRPHFADGKDHIRHIDISPTGIRAVMEVRGEILTAPTKKGDVRNITNTPGVHEREPAWSPDGRWIAYFSDEGGEYQLMLKDHAKYISSCHITIVRVI